VKIENGWHPPCKLYVMQFIVKSVAAISLALATLNGSYPTGNTTNALQETTPVAEKTNPVKPKIQVAILLDVSNSMDGLIEQAKAQLWNMVSVMGKVRCSDDLAPGIEIALYEYGRPSNGEASGYVKRINAFTTDLDQLSQNLFKLTTYGGAEYCGHVMYTSLTELPWDTTAGSYKVIFIAGNEDFLQGKVHWTKACELARQKGVVINTIYCGSREQGIREHWNLGGECGTGSYTNINHYAKIEEMDTPYDDTLFVLNNQLNATYIAYGQHGAASRARQEATDAMNYSMNKSAAAQRVSVKGKKELYNNSSWDLVDAAATDPGIVNKVDRKTLPAEYRAKSNEELQQIIIAKSKERTAIQKKIAEISAKREAYIAAEQAKKAGDKSNQPTLYTEIEKIITKQVQRYNMKIK
jgi:hypothetical protein